LAEETSRSGIRRTGKNPGKTGELAQAGFMEVKVATQSTFQMALGSPQSQVCIESTGVRITAGGDYPVDKLVALVREVTL